MASIYGKEHPLRDIFSDQFAFTIPPFQRPYAWQIEHAVSLIDDLIAFMQGTESVKELPPYFLGSIVLIKKEGLPDAEIVDGQQRLTTLTILLAALRELVAGKLSEQLTKFIYEEGNDIADTPNRYRLTLRERDADFFQKYIQHDGGIKKLRTLDPTALSDSQKNIHANTLALIERIEELTVDQRFRLAQAMILQCYLVEISTSDLDSAYNVFSVLNDRGLNITHADILKAQIIGTIPAHLRNKYTAKWESTEELLRKRMFLNLFGYLNMIYQNETESPPEPSLLKRFRKQVYPTTKPDPNPVRFIDETFLPHAKALDIIINANYQSRKRAREVNKLLKWLYLPQTSEHPDIVGTIPWMAVTMHYLTLNWNNPDLIIRFLTDLERLEIVLRVASFTGIGIKNRRLRFGRLIAAIKRGEDLFVPDSPLQVTLAEKNNFLETLAKDFYTKPMCLYILLRVDDALAAADEPSYNYSAITIEHVLPQNPKPNSTWIKWFPQEAVRKEYTHCMGNLLLLSRPKNSEAQNYDFTEKKRKYFFSEKGASTFALTTQVLQEEKWTPEVIERRQEILLNTLKKIWLLD